MTAAQQRWLRTQKSKDEGSEKYDFRGTRPDESAPGPNAFDEDLVNAFKKACKAFFFCNERFLGEHGIDEPVEDVETHEKKGGRLFYPAYHKPVHPICLLWASIFDVFLPLPSTPCPTMPGLYNCPAWPTSHLGGY